MQQPPPDDNSDDELAERRERRTQQRGKIRRPSPGEIERKRRHAAEDTRRRNQGRR